jgi:hypothetical protein
MASGTLEGIMKTAAFLLAAELTWSWTYHGAGGIPSGAVIERQKSYESPGTLSLRRLRCLPDGGSIVIASTHTSPPDSGMWIARLSPDGAIAWQTILRTGWPTEAIDVVPLRDGGLAAVASVRTTEEGPLRRPFDQRIVAADRDHLVWDRPADVYFVMGSIGDLSAGYGALASGFLPAASALDISSDDPVTSSGFYYPIRSRARGSWQSSIGAEPGRDAALP